MLNNSMVCAGPVAMASSLDIDLYCRFFSISVYEFTQQCTAEP